MSGNIFIMNPPSGQMEDYVSRRTLTAKTKHAIKITLSGQVFECIPSTVKMSDLPVVVGESSPEPGESCCVQEQSRMA